jgi:excisionase family DNA binding protein
VHWATAPIRVPEKSLLRIGEVAAAVGFSDKTIRTMIKEGKFPQGRLVGGEMRWTNMAVGAWLLWQDYAPPPAAEPGATSAKPAAEAEETPEDE